MINIIPNLNNMTKYLFVCNFSVINKNLTDNLCYIQKSLASYTFSFCVKMYSLFRKVDLKKKAKCSNLQLVRFEINSI